MRTYDSGLEISLAAAEREALPSRIARQPLRAIGAWVAQMDHQDIARAYARARFPAITCALQLIAGIPAWTPGCLDGAANARIWTARVVTGIEPIAAQNGGSLYAELQ
jgi:hypothetical protein